MAKRKKPRKAPSTQSLRTRPCPCGSGKSFAQCHGRTAATFQVRPSNKPEVIDYYMTSPDGVHWEKHPGNLIVGIGGRRTKDTHDEIESILSRFSPADAEGPHALREDLDAIRHKLYAVKYHLDTTAREVERQVADFEREYKATSGVFLELDNPRLIFETEAFLFQAKSTLDILVHALGTLVPPLSTMHTFKSRNVDGEEHVGGAVINALRLNSYPALADLLESARMSWIQPLVQMRDTVAHYRALRGFHSFVEEPYMGGEEVTIHYPTMPNGIRVDAYCDEVYNALMQLVGDSLQLAMDTGKRAA